MKKLFYMLGGVAVCAIAVVAASCGTEDEAESECTCDFVWKGDITTRVEKPEDYNVTNCYALEDKLEESYEHGHTGSSVSCRAR